MGLGPGRLNPRQIIHHTLQGSDGGSPSTAVTQFNMDGLVLDASGTVNAGFPRAVRLGRLWMNTGTLGVVSSGDWTLRLRLNRTTTDHATFTFNPVDADDVFSGYWTYATNGIIVPTDQYHMRADGPGRTLMFIRVVMELEVF